MSEAEREPPAEQDDRARLDRVARIHRHRTKAGASALGEGMAHLLGLWLLMIGILNAGNEGVECVLAGLAAVWIVVAYIRMRPRSPVEEAELGRMILDIRAIGDPRAIGPLLDMLAEIGDAGREEIWAAIDRVAPRMDDATIDALSIEQLEGLRLVLRRAAAARRVPEEDQRLPALIAILRAVARRGYVPAHMEAGALTAERLPREVRRAARACLTQLNEAARYARLSSTLLRATDAPDAERLLRPSASVGDEQLLRPSQGDDE